MPEIKDYLEIVNHATVIGGVIWAIVQWPKARREKKERSAKARTLLSTIFF